MRRGSFLTLTAGVALTLLAAGVQLSAPDDNALQAPFVQHGSVDPAGVRLAAGRDVTATVTGVRITKSVHADSWNGITTGVWVVVDARIGTVLTSGLPDAVLLLDGVTYDASDRPDSAALTGILLQPGLPYAGAFLFELPRAAISGNSPKNATIRIFSNRDPALDSAIDVPLNLANERVQSSLVLDPPTRVAP